MANEEMVPRRVTRDLPVKLSQAELAGIAKEIGRLSKHRGELEAQAKQVAAHWKDRIGGVDAQIHDLAQRADEGIENRPVECEEQKDYRVGEVRVVRLDTKETLEVRPMTSDERQPTLPLEEPPKKKKRGAKADAEHAEAEQPEDPEEPPPEEEQQVEAAAEEQPMSELPEGTEIDQPGELLEAAGEEPEQAPKKGRRK